MGSPTLGDPQNTQSNAGNVINSFWSSGSLVSQTTGQKILSSIGLGSYKNPNTVGSSECSLEIPIVNICLSTVFDWIVGFIVVIVIGLIIFTFGSALIGPISQ